MRALRYDAAWTETVPLRDGSSVELRCLRPTDREELHAAFHRLSAESRYRRFFSDTVELSPDMLDYLTKIDGHDHFALVAHRASPDLKSDIGIGVARFIRLRREPKVAEAAITVTDDAQGLGLGRLLLDHLRKAALEREVDCFRTSLLGTNDAMAKLVSAGFVHESDGTVVVIDVPLTDPDEPTLHRLLRLAASSVATWVKRFGLKGPPADLTGIARHLQPWRSPRTAGELPPTLALVSSEPKRTLAVLTSGGDAPGMNSAVRAIAKVAAGAGVEVVGVLAGYDGLVDGNFLPLTQPGASAAGLTTTEECDRVAAAGGTFLGSARSSRFRTSDGRAAGAKQLEGKLGLIVLGGDGSLTGAHLLAKEHGVRVIGIPASIDNDIGYSGMSLGVDTALNTIVEACDKISDTAISHQRAFVVEVMGRSSGYLAMAAGISAGADGVLLPEQGKAPDQIVGTVADVIERAMARGKRRVLLLKAEGVPVPCTRLVREVEELLSSRRLSGIEVRGTVLGHLVRGGRPSHQDRMIASRLGRAAVHALLDGETDKMCAWQPTHPTGKATMDPAVALFPILEVLAESKRLLDGTSEVTKWRLEMMKELDEVLGL